MSKLNDPVWRKERAAKATAARLHPNTQAVNFMNRISEASDGILNLVAQEVANEVARRSGDES